MRLCCWSNWQDSSQESRERARGNDMQKIVEPSGLSACGSPA